MSSGCSSHTTHSSKGYQRVMIAVRGKLATRSLLVNTSITTISIDTATQVDPTARARHTQPPTPTSITTTTPPPPHLLPIFTITVLRMGCAWPNSRDGVM